MDSFTPLIAPWFLESSFLSGDQDFSHHPITPTSTTPTTLISSSTSSTSSSCGGSCSGSYDHIGSFQDDAVEHLIFSQDIAKFYPSPAYSPVLDLYSPFGVPALPRQLDVDVPQRRRRRQSTKPAARVGSPVENTSYYCQHAGCGKVFSRPYNLTSHMRTHTSERPYPCSRCGRRFARQHDRNRHEKLHWNIKPHVCSNCSKPFARMDALNRHLRVENGCGSAVAAVAAAMAASNTPFVHHPTH